MKKKRALSASRMPDAYDRQDQENGYVIRDPSREPNTIVFHSGGHSADTEMLKITLEGFWVRGKKVEQDDKEAEIVYNAFKEFLTYHALTRTY